MNVLSVIDVSAVVSVGSTSRFFVDRSNYGYPVGGINYLMRQVVNNLVSSNSVVLCFDSPTEKGDLIPSYKSGRTKHPEVYSQINFVYEMLPACGIPCEKYNGYEADDIIHWAVEQLRDKYVETMVVGNDLDLCHEVRPGVLFKSICPSVPNISANNFKDAVDKTPTKFNTISAKKAIMGCSSDKVPPLKLENGMSPAEVYSRFLQSYKDRGIIPCYETTSDRRYLLSFAKESGLFTENDMTELAKRVVVVYPLECPKDVEIIPASSGTVDFDALVRFLTMTNDYDSLRCLRSDKVRLTEDEKQMLRDKQRSLSSGEFAADNNIGLDSSLSVQTLELNSFVKEY